MHRLPRRSASRPGHARAPVLCWHAPADLATVEASEGLVPSTLRARRGAHGRLDERLLGRLSHFCAGKLLPCWCHLARSGLELSHARRRSLISVLAHCPPALV